MWSLRRGGHHVGLAEHIGVDKLLLFLFRHLVVIKRADDLGADLIELLRREVEPRVGVV